MKDEVIKVSRKASDESTAEFRRSAVEIAAPMAFWVFLLIAALAAKIFAASGTITDYYLIEVLRVYSGFMLSTSGMVVLPLAVGAFVGAEVGKVTGSLTKAARGGFLNGLYAAMVYTITVMIIYETLTYAAPSSVPDKALVLNSWIALPVVVLMALSEIFALVSHARRTNG